MKKYLKIFIITLAIQLGCYGLGILISDLLKTVDNSSDIPLLCTVLGFPISFIVDIVLSIKWGNSLKEKLLLIFLMPTNYTFLLLLFYAMHLLNQWIDILVSLPDDFG